MPFPHATPEPWDGIGVVETTGTEAATLEEHVAALLRQQILGRQLRPGDRVITDRLARELGMSRIPVRQALQRLDGAGLIELRPHRGAIVAIPDEHPVPAMLELIEVRLRLEPWAAGLAAQHRSGRQLAALRRSVAAGRRAARDGDPAAAAGQHHAIVEAVVAASGNSALVESFRPLLNRTALLFAMLTDNGAEPVTDGWSHHAHVVDAIGSSDSDAAAAATRRHLRHIAKALRH